jgi:hypothetical protein
MYQFIALALAARINSVDIFAGIWLGGDCPSVVTSGPQLGLFTTRAGHLGICCSAGHKRSHGSSISCLQEHRSRSREFADQAFGRRYTGNYATRCHALELVFTIPSDEMAVVNNVSFVGLEL